MSSIHLAGLPVVVGIDGSRSALDATRWAAHEARRRHTGLRLVEALGWLPVEDEPAGEHVDPSYPDVLLRGARERLAAAAATAAAEVPGIAVGTEVMSDYPVPRLVAESAAAQLLVVGARGLAGITGLLIGSVAAGVAAHAACPTVVVRTAVPGGPVPHSGPVVVGIDGSPVSEAALAFAFDAAASRATSLVAVHTWQDSLIDDAVAPLIDWRAIETEERQLLAERLAGWGERYPGVPVERFVVRDRPAHALHERSVGAQLLVVGSRGRGALTGLLLGSVSQTVLHHAACPVVIVRPATG
jgi:nucleotide-binding universal stress UspA family protein